MWSIVGALFIIALFLGWRIYSKLFSPNVTLPTSGQYLYIPTGSDINDVYEILEKGNSLIDGNSFLFTARQLNYDKNVKPGRYKVKSGMSNRELILLLRAGRQTPVRVVFNNIRTKEQFASRIGEQIEATPKAILNLMNDPDYCHSIGFSTSTIACVFIPDTYEMYWNTSADQFIRKMLREYEKFWNARRKALAKEAGFSPVEVSILASIVQQESNREDEKPVIAGVYINRLNKNWKLEADPTLVFALGDFSIKRVLNAHKEIESPYNTYKFKGLPPGPICFPTISSIESVLNYSRHSYMYFCAKDDFSGYHSFAKTYVQHLVNARKFQRALNQRGIKS